MHRQIAGKLTGRVTKWFVLAFWIIAVAAMVTPASKLTDQLNNETSSWLPGSAESTKALDKLKPFQDPNAIPTVVVYEKKSGLGPEDLAAMKQQATDFQGLKGVEGKVVGPIPVRGRASRPDPGDVQPRQERLERHAGDQGRHHRHREDRRRQCLRGRQRRPGRRLRRGLRRAGRSAARHHPARRHRHPADRLPQPDPVDPPHLLGGDRALRGPGRRLLPRQVRRPHRQRPEPGHPHRPRPRRRNRLRTAPRREIQGRAPPPRGPARGDGLRPAPGRTGHHRQRVHRRPRHAVPVAGGDELHRRARTGRRHRRRRRDARDGHPAPCSAGDLRAMVLLAVPPRIRIPGADHDRLLVPRRDAHLPPPAPRVDHDLRAARRCRVRDPLVGLQRPDDRGLLHQGVRLGRRSDVC